MIFGSSLINLNLTKLTNFTDKSQNASCGVNKCRRCRLHKSAPFTIRYRTNWRVGSLNKTSNCFSSKSRPFKPNFKELIDGGALNNINGAGNPAVSLVHAQNIADQMNFLKSQISNFGTDSFTPKFINDVVRDVQDIVASDPPLLLLLNRAIIRAFNRSLIS